MVVWGGFSAGGSSGGWKNTGGVYNPTTDTWTATSLVNAPSARFKFGTTYGAGKVIIWSGYNVIAGGIYRSGGMYDPVLNTWTATNLVGSAGARSYFIALWISTKMFVFGGENTATHIRYNDGYLYDPSNNSWTVISNVNQTDTRSGGSAVWTGTSVIINTGHDANGNWATQPAIYTP